METLRFLYPFCRRYWKRYLLGLLLLPPSSFAFLAIPALIREAILVLEESATPQAGLLWVIGGILACALVRGVTLFATRYLVITASRWAEYDLRNALFAHVQSLDQLFFKSSHTGDLMARMSTDVDRARIIIGPVIMYSASTLCMLLVAMPLMLSLNWTLTLFVMLPLCLLTIAVRIIGPRVHTQVLKAQETLSHMSTHAQEDFAGVRVVKAFAQEKSETHRFGESAQQYYNENLRAAKYAAWMHPVIGGVGDLGQLFIILVGGYFILSGNLKLADLIAFIGYLMLLLWPMMSIGWVVNQYQRGSASVIRIRELLSRPPAIVSVEETTSPPAGKIEGMISVRGLTFSFGNAPVLSNVSLEAPLGHTVAIIGRTGSGKSTLVSLIQRIYPVPTGTVFVDGVDVNDLDLDELRQAIGYVPQESFLFSRTINQNIAFGRPDADQKEIDAVAELVRIDKDVDQFPRGYEELVGERGVTLSGGQRQRTTLARALITRPRILILDDCLSAVDTETEEEILTNLKRHTENLTTLVISHRISSVQHADRIYVLDEGRVVEEGVHQELIKQGGVYAEIHRLQLISQQLDSM